MISPRSMYASRSRYSAGYGDFTRHTANSSLSWVSYYTHVGYDHYLRADLPIRMYITAFETRGNPYPSYRSYVKSYKLKYLHPKLGTLVEYKVSDSHLKIFMTALYFNFILSRPIL